MKKPSTQCYVMSFLSEVVSCIDATVITGNPALKRMHEREDGGPECVFVISDASIENILAY